MFAHLAVVMLSNEQCDWLNAKYKWFVWLLCRQDFKASYVRLFWLCFKAVLSMPEYIVLNGNESKMVCTKILNIYTMLS